MGSVSNQGFELLRPPLRIKLAHSFHDRRSVGTITKLDVTSLERNGTTMRLVLLILFITVLGCGDDSPSNSGSSPKSNSTSSPDSLPEPETATNSDNTTKSTGSTNHGLATGDDVIVLKDARLTQDSGTETVLAKGKRLTVSKVDGDRIWTNVLSPVLLKGHTSPVNCAAFSPDGKRVVSCGGSVDEPGEAMLWDANTGKLLDSLTTPGTELPYLSRIAFSPLGHRIAATAYADSTVIIWEKDKVLFRFACPLYPRDIAFSPDGKLLAVAESGYHPDRTKRKYVACDVSVWDLDTGKQTMTLKGNRRDVHRVSFSIDGTMIASCGKDGAIYIWNSITGDQIRTWPTGSAMNGIVFLPGGKFIASTGETGGVRIWDLKTGKAENILAFTGARGTGLDCSPDGKLIACGDTLGFVRIWNADRELTLKFKAHTAGTGVAFSGDGKRLVSGSSDSSVTVWNIGTGKGLSGWVPANNLLKIID